MGSGSRGELTEAAGRVTDKSMREGISAADRLPERDALSSSSPSEAARGEA